MKTKVSIGPRGEIVIPKLIRQSMGLMERGSAILELKDHTLNLRPLPAEDIPAKWRGIARQHGGRASKLVYGDRLYEEGF